MIKDTENVTFSTVQVLRCAYDEKVNYFMIVAYISLRENFKKKYWNDDFIRPFYEVMFLIDPPL